MTNENKALAPTNINNEVDRIARAAAKGGGNRLMKFKKGEFFVGSEMSRQDKSFCLLRRLAARLANVGK